MNGITQEELKELFNYNFKTGIFRYKKVSKYKIGTLSVGSIAGHKHKKDIRIIIKGRSYAAHKLAWLYVYGEYPQERLDHKNRDGHYNAIRNLRKATNGQNRANSRANRNNTTGYKGVTLAGGSKINPYHAQISANGKYRHIGLFPTPEQAHEAYCREAKKEFKEFYHSGS